MLVIDTFPGLAGLRGEEENDAGAVGERLHPLQVAAGEGLAVLFLHHMNGQSQPRGSKAFRGIVDISLRLERKKNAIWLKTESRFATDLPATVEGRLVKAPDGWFYAPIVKSERREIGSCSSVDEQLLKALTVPRLPREAREGVMRVWLQILREKHPGTEWVPVATATSSG